MNERQKRLIEVYNYVRQHFGIHTKQGFAEALNYGRTSMSAALNGNEGYLTDSLFKSICAAFPGTFNLDYLLTGEGELLVEQKDDPAIPSKMQDMIDQYKQEIQRLNDAMEPYKQEIKRLNDAMEPYKQEIKRLNDMIDSQREIIEDLKMLVNNFKNQYRYIQPDDDNPFVSDNTPVNVFDKKK